MADSTNPADTPVVAVSLDAAAPADANVVVVSGPQSSGTDNDLTKRQNFQDRL